MNFNNKILGILTELPRFHGIGLNMDSPETRLFRDISTEFPERPYVF